MPDHYHVNYTLYSAQQLENIFDYIERDSPQNAARMIERLIQSIESLSLFPGRYGLLRNIDTLGVEIHSMPVRPYLIRYHINLSSKTVTILSIRHGARRPGL
jgi:plasmid stabilization system protein ParE